MTGLAVIPIYNPDLSNEGMLTKLYYLNSIYSGWQELQGEEWSLIKLCMGFTSLNNLEIAGRRHDTIETITNLKHVFWFLTSV